MAKAALFLHRLNHNGNIVESRKEDDAKSNLLLYHEAISLLTAQQTRLAKFHKAQFELE